MLSCKLEQVCSLPHSQFKTTPFKNTPQTMAYHCRASHTRMLERLEYRPTQYNDKSGAGVVMNFQSMAAEFWQKGYLCCDNFFDDELMDRCQKHILDEFGDDPDFVHNEEFLERSNTDVIPWFPQRDGVDAFDIVEQDSRLQALTEAILGGGWASLYSMVMFSKQGSKGQSWHQDCPPEDISRFNLNRLVYSMDIDASIGGETLVVPGSHRIGTISAGDGDEVLAGEIALSPKKGTLIMIHGHLWHRVKPVHGRYRASINYRCCPANTPTDVTDICVYRNMRYQFSTHSIVEERL
jgi:ectoine hydroxylase